MDPIVSFFALKCNFKQLIVGLNRYLCVFPQMACAHSQLLQYQDRYKSCLKASNLMYIR